MTTTDWLAEEFQEHRAHLRAVSYRMLGSLAEADDAVQETWLRLTGADTGDVRNLRAWLTTVVSRVCLDMLRARTARRENPLDVHVPDPVVTLDDPEEHALLADSVGLALLVVLDTLSPAERLAFVLHDVFAVPFEQIGSALDRSPAAAKQLASRARHRLRGAGVSADATEADPSRQRAVAEAFLAASRGDDFEGLLAILDPDVVLRADAGDGPMGPSRLITGAREVATQAHRFASLARFAHPVLVNGTPGFLVAPDGQPLAVIGIAVRDDKIAEIAILADPERLSRLDLADLIR
ncbi:MAG: sigma-70 family RNA polymerase sigma factor [Streptosporangiaceae bacterium]